MAKRKSKKEAPKITESQMGDSTLYEHDRVGQSVNYGMTLIFQVDQIRKSMTMDFLDMSLNGVRTLERMLSPYINNKFKVAKKKLDQEMMDQFDTIDPWSDLEMIHMRENIIRAYTNSLFELCLNLMSDNGFLPEHGMVETI